jgi:hypothetical protein
MDIPVLLEPTPTGWRASTGGPFNLVTEGRTQDDAIASLEKRFQELVLAGRVVRVAVNPDPLFTRLAAFREDDKEILDEVARIIRQTREESGFPDPDEELFPEAPHPERNGHPAPAPGEVQPTRS